SKLRERSERSSSTTPTVRSFCFRRGAGRNRVNGEAEGVGDKNQHHWIGAKASQLFPRQTIDIEKMCEQPRSLPQLLRRLWASSIRGHVTSPACAELIALQRDRGRKRPQASSR